MSGPPGFPFPGFRPGMPGAMGFPGAPPFPGAPGMPGMRPMMMQHAGMAAMGAMGMPGMGLGMGMPGLRPQMPTATPLSRPMMGNTPLAKSVYVPPSIAEKSTTVYVGKIASTVPDSVIRTLLDACGRVKSWKRQMDPDTKQPKGFGFCEFEDAEGVLRAMRLLNGLKMDGSELLLKCNAATQKYTEQYEQQKAAQKAEKKAKAAAAKAGGEAAAGADGAEGEKEGEGDKEAGEAEEDEDAAADNRVLEVIMSVVSDREDTSRGGALPPPPPIPASGVPGAAQAANEFLAQLAAPGGGSKLASQQQPDAENDVKDREARDRDRELREREREWAREADAERRKEEDRRRELDVKYEAKLREWERYERERAALRERERERRAQSEAEWRRAVRSDLEAYESDDDREPWERRPLYGSRKAAERRKRRLAEEEEDEVDRQREARENERRAKRAAAAAAEASAHEGTPGPAASVVCDAQPGAAPEAPPYIKAEPKTEPKAEPEVDTNDPIYQAMLAAARAPPPAPQPHPPPAHTHAHAHAHGGAVKGEHEAERAPGPQGHEHGHYREHAHDRGVGYGGAPESPNGQAGGARSTGAVSGSASGAAGGAAPAAGARIAFGAGSRGRNSAALAAMFGDEEETTQKRQLKPIRYSEEELLAVSDAVQAPQPNAVPTVTPAAAPPAAPADPKAALKAMMDSIPTSREGVFSYQIKWSHYIASAMGEKFKGWVSSKVEQLLGVKEPTLVDYVVKLLGQHTSPAQLHSELSPVLDNDTETFVIKLYRMVIYETEKTALGLGQAH